MATYMHPNEAAPTAGFLGGGFGEAVGPFVDERKGTVGTKRYWEPSPVISVSGLYGLTSGFVNVCLHVVVLTCTIIVTAWYLPADKNHDFNDDHKFLNTHSIDYVRQWIIVMCVTQCVTTAWTVLWYGLVFKAFAFPLAAHLGLGLQLVATTCAIKISLWIAFFGKTVDNDRPKGVDNLLPVIVYAGLFLIAGYIMTPMSGTYFKLINEMPNGEPSSNRWTNGGQGLTIDLPYGFGKKTITAKKPADKSPP
jgi:hypothetical protein